MNTDEKISAILRMEADAVDPSPAAFDIIRTGVAKRRRRIGWLSGLTAAAAALAVVAVAVVVTGGKGTPRGIQPATASPSAPSARRPEDTTGTPIGAIWPLTTSNDVNAWLADHAHYPSLATAQGSALAFAHTYLGISDAVVAPAGATWEVRRPSAARAVSRLDVRGFGPGGAAPYVVTAATSPGLRLAPLDAAIRTPLRVHGTFTDVDPAILVTLRTHSNAATPSDIAMTNAVTGPPDVWTASVAFRTNETTGSVLAVNKSNKDGGVIAAAATPVTFVQPDIPSEMVVSRAGRVAVVSTATGDLVRWLTPANVPASDPSLSRDGTTVVYVETTGKCKGVVAAVPFAGGPSRTLDTPASGLPSGPALDGDNLSYGTSDCVGKSALSIGSAGQGTDETLPGPPVGDLAVLGRFTSYVTRESSGTVLHVRESTATPNDSPTDTPIAPPDGCQWEAATLVPSGAQGAAVIGAAGCAGVTTLFDVTTGGQVQHSIGDVALAVHSLDSTPSGALLLGNGEAAFVYRNGVVTDIPGSAARPSW